MVAILADALEWLVGDPDDGHSVESCSGGLLGKEIGGVNVFTYQVPGMLLWLAVVLRLLDLIPLYGKIFLKQFSVSRYAA